MSTLSSITRSPFAPVNLGDDNGDCDGDDDCGDEDADDLPE